MDGQKRRTCHFHYMVLSTGLWYPPWMCSLWCSLKWDKRSAYVSASLKSIYVHVFQRGSFPVFFSLLTTFPNHHNQAVNPYFCLFSSPHQVFFSELCTLNNCLPLLPYMTIAEGNCDREAVYFWLDVTYHMSSSVIQTWVLSFGVVDHRKCLRRALCIQGAIQVGGQGIQAIDSSLIFPCHLDRFVPDSSWTIYILLFFCGTEYWIQGHSTSDLYP